MVGSTVCLNRKLAERLWIHSNPLGLGADDGEVPRVACHLVLAEEIDRCTALAVALDRKNLASPVPGNESCQRGECHSRPNNYSASQVTPFFETWQGPFDSQH